MKRSMLAAVLIAVLAASFVAVLDEDSDAGSMAPIAGETYVLQTIHCDEGAWLEDWLTGPCQDGYAAVEVIGGTQMMLKPADGDEPAYILFEDLDRRVSIHVNPGKLLGDITIKTGGDSYGMVPDQWYKAGGDISIGTVDEVFDISYFGVDKADNSGNPTSYTISTGFEIKPPVWEGHTFLHWYDRITGHIFDTEGTVDMYDLTKVGDLEMKAVWDKEFRYIETHYNNDFVTESEGEAYLDGNDIIHLPEVIAKGAILDHWTYTVNGETHDVADGQVVTKKPSYVTAEWDFDVYAITYLGEPPPGIQMPGPPDYPDSYTCMEKTVIPNPVSVQHRFLGWTDQNMAEPVLEYSVYGHFGSLQLTMHWEYVDQVEVALDMNGKTTDPTFTGKAYVNSEKVLIIPFEYPQSPGYLFEGWFTEPVGGTRMYYGSVCEVNTLYAHWETLTYSVSYVGMGTESLDNPPSYTADDTFTLNNPDPSLGVFLGWTGNGFETPVINMTVVKGTTGDLVFTAVWGADAYKIAYTGVEGADNSMNPREYDGTEDVVLKDPVKADSRFLGWTGKGYAIPTRGAVIPAGTEGNLVFSAHWASDGYDITYIGIEGASNHGNPTAYVAGESFTLAAPSKLGYSFIGWTGNGVSEPTADMKVEAGTVGDLTFTAHWNAVEYPVEYIGTEGAEVSGNPDSYTIEDSFTLANPVRDGYRFTGWLTQDSSRPAAEVTVEKGTTGVLKFVACWSVVEYGIGYGGMDMAVNIMNPSTYNVTQEVTLRDPMKPGYRFIGWTCDGVSEPTPSLVIPKGTTGELFYTAHWEIVSYTITYNGMEGADNSGNPDSYTIKDRIDLRAPVRADYEFIGWTVGSGHTLVFDITIHKGTTGDLTYTAHWEFAADRIQLDVGGKHTEPTYREHAERAEDGTVTLPSVIPQAEGYTFAGWYTELQGGVMVGDGGKTDADVLYAHWDTVIYRISYAGLGGADNSANPDTYTVEDGFVLSDPVKEGYMFRGWTGLGVTEPVRNLEVVKGTTGDLQFNAYMQMSEYVVVYTWLLGADNSANPVRYNVTQSYELVNPEKEGYEFLGWTGTGITEPTLEAEIPAGTTGALHFKANWKAIQYTITYNGTDSAANPNPGTYDVRDLPLELEPPVREGYTFVGWEHDGTVSEEYTVPMGTTGDLTFNAVWEQIFHKVTVTAEGGILRMNGTEVEGASYAGEYAHGTPVTVTGDSLRIGGDGFEAVHPDHDTVTWSVTGNLDSVTCDMSVKALFSDSEDFITEVSIFTKPLKTEYVLEESFDPAGLSLQVMHKSGSFEIVESGYTYLPKVFMDIDTKAVEIDYSGFTVSCPVTVTDGLERICITSPPAKTEYVYGEWFDPTGMEVTAVYISGVRETVTGYTCTPELLDRIGETEIDVSYMGFHAYLDVTVSPVPEPEEQYGFVRVHVDESGKISQDAALAAVWDIMQASQAGFGGQITVGASAPVSEELYLPDVLMDAVREFASYMTVQTKYGTMELGSDAFCTDAMGDAGMGVHIQKTSVSGVPEGFGDWAFDIRVEDDRGLRPHLDAPVKVVLRYDSAGGEARVYSLSDGAILPVDAVTPSDRIVAFEMSDSSVFSVKNASQEFDVTVTHDGEGTVTADPVRAEQHVTVTVTAAADSGYELRGITVNGDEVAATDGVCIFEMPSCDVTVNAVFAESGQSSVSFAAIIAIAVLAVIAAAAIVMVRRKA